MSRRGAAGGLVAATFLLAGCASGDSDSMVQQVVKDVLQGKTGTVTSIKALRGTGPFLEYPVPPDEMVHMVGRALKKKTVAVFENERAYEVVAKERSADRAHDDWYAPDWLSAVVVFVHPVEGDEGRSRIEIHATSRGAAWRGKIDWTTEVPRLVEEEVEHRGESRVQPL